MSTFTFTTTDYDGPEQIEVVTVTGRSDTWTEQADLFFRFLLAQGFMVSENDLAEFFLEKADEIGQNRANTYLEDEPERRIFYIDVGNLPKKKAEQYVQDIVNEFKNKIVYDASTGDIRDEQENAKGSGCCVSGRDENGCDRN